MIQITALIIQPWIQIKWTSVPLATQWPQ